MNKLRTFYYSFKRSLTDPSYYRDILKVPFSFSFKYFLILTLLMSVFYSVFLAFSLASLIPQAPKFVETFKTRVRTAYPQELVINIKNGKFSTNVQEPFYYDIPELTEEDSDYEYFLAIDTTASVDDYKDYNSLILVTEKAVVYPDGENSGVPTQKITYFDEKAEPITFNRNMYDNLVKEYLPLADYIPAVLIALTVFTLLISPFIIAFFMAAWYMLQLLILSFIAWIVSLIFKNNLTYGKIYQLGLHAFTLPILVSTLVSQMADVPFFLSAGFVLWMVIILSKIKEPAVVKHS